MNFCSPIKVLMAKLFITLTVCTRGKKINEQENNNSELHT